MATYSINIDDIEVIDLSKNLFAQDVEAVVSTDAAGYFFEEAGIILNENDLEESFNAFCDTEEYRMMLDNIFEIVMSEAYILQSDKISDEKIEMVMEFCSNITVVYLPILCVHALALTSGGTNTSDSLELAYLIIDGESPFQGRHPGLTLGSRGVAALYKLRELNTLQRMGMTLHRLKTMVDEKVINEKL